MRKLLVILISTFLAFLSFFFIYKHILDPVFIPDYCYFHTHETPWITYILYDFLGVNNGHPSASNLILLLFVFMFNVLGFLVLKRCYRKN